jgi:hypothetical protein
MLLKGEVKAILVDLNRLHDQAIRSKNQPFIMLYSKLAVLELGGWTEDCIDNILIRYVSKKVKSKDFIDYMNYKIKYTYGFDEEKHFKSLFGLIGIHHVEKVEKKMDPQVKQKLFSALNTLWKERSARAHQTVTLPRPTQNFSTPSVCIRLFQEIFDGLQEYERLLKKEIKYK